MHAVLEILAATLATGAAVAGLTVGAVLRRLRRSNRLVPGRRSSAPLAWRWSPGRLAVLHRRLRRSCELIVAVTGVPGRRRWLRRRRPAPASALQAAGEELLERALAADAALTAARRGSPAWRSLRIPDVAREVAAVEAGAARLARLDTQVRRHAAVDAAPPGAESLLDAFEAALAELRPTRTGLTPPG